MVKLNRIMKIIKKIKEEIKYYGRDFWGATLSSAFTHKLEMPAGKTYSKLSPKQKESLKIIKRLVEASETEKKEKEISLKQRALNNAFYATIGQVIVSVILGVPFPFQTGSFFYLLFATDAMFYILLGFMVSKGRRWAGIILFVWFCLDKLLPGIIRLFTYFSFLGLFYFALFNYFFGQFYYKALRYLRENVE